MNYLKILFKKIYWKIAKKIGFVLLFRDERPSIHSEKLKLFKTITGNYYLPKFAYQDVIRREIIKNKIFDEEVFNLSKEFIKPNSVVLDAGANYGQMSILFSKLFSDLTVYSFEASVFIFNILSKNIELNSNNIKAINCVLSNTKGEEYLVKPSLKEYGTYGSEVVKFASDKSNRYENKTLIKKIDDFKFEKKISFMKIDVEGWDLKVLEGSLKTIQQNRMPIIFEYASEYEKKMDYSLDDYVNFFKSINYKFLTSQNNNFLVIPKEYS